MTKIIATVLLAALLGVFLAAGIGYAFSAPAAAPQTAPQAPAESDGYVLVPAELWAKVSAALEHWYDEAQRLKKSKGCV